MKQYKQVSLKHHEVSFLGWQVLLIYFVLNLTCIFLISALFSFVINSLLVSFTQGAYFGPYYIYMPKQSSIDVL